MNVVIVAITSITLMVSGFATPTEAPAETVNTVVLSSGSLSGSVL